MRAALRIAESCGWEPQISVLVQALRIHLSLNIVLNLYITKRSMVLVTDSWFSLICEVVEDESGTSEGMSASLAEANSTTKLHFSTWITYLHLSSNLDLPVTKFEDVSSGFSSYDEWPVAPRLTYLNAMIRVAITMLGLILAMNSSSASIDETLPDVERVCSGLLGKTNNIIANNQVVFCCTAIVVPSIWVYWCRG